MDVAIIGGGICGLSLALNLKERGIACRVYERAPEIKELGVGITLLPHAMREFSALGLGDELLTAGIENRESRFYNRFGQLIYKESRGKLAGYQYPEVCIHRGRLHMILYNAARNRLGADAIRTDHECTGVEQDERGATVHFKARESIRADVVVDCEGINSAIRKQFYPDDKVAFAGINTWRGITRRKPILDGRTYMRVGSILTGKIVIYPIINDIDGEGRQLINWMAEIKRDTFAQNDWNKPGSLDDFFPLYESWRFDWLDVAQLIRDADQILEYPMVDKDPIDTWTYGRVTLAGDAAHPMYPRGSNGAAQAAIDAPRSGNTKPRAQVPPPRSCAPTAITRPISSISRSRNWSATSRSTISTNTSRRMNCARCRRTTSASPASRSPTWPGGEGPVRRDPAPLTKPPIIQ
jgi:2-polyprenyl-6-methoxyphenol hydroxylase-like FAD-dependent oxidoreductase